MRRGRRTFVVIGTVIVVALVAVATGWRLAGIGPAEPESSADATSSAGPVAFRTFHGDGFTFDYPDAWGFFPMKMSASFFTTLGYLASQPVDVARICDEEANGVRCDFRNYDLQPGAVVVELAAWGTPTVDPLAMWDRPTEGRRIEIGGMPAIEIVDNGLDRTAVRWQIARPDGVGNWIQLDAEAREPGRARRIAELQLALQSFRFDPPPKPLQVATADDVAAAALDALRRQDAEAFACFPPNGGAVRAEVTAAPGAPLRAPLQATCSTRIAATDIGFWRLELVVAWGDPDEPGNRYTTIQWVDGRGGLSMQSSGGGNLPNCCRG